MDGSAPGIAGTNRAPHNAAMKIIVLAALLILSSAALATAGGPTPVGLWRVIDDVSGEAEALVRINERDGVYEGTIIEVFVRPGVAPNSGCELCPGERKDRPVKGLTILTGLTRHGDTYDGGEILDPDSGDLYHCTVRVSADNDRLFVRGYLGFSIFGRTQTWLRQ